MGQFKRKFKVEGDIDHQPLLVSENWIAFSCGIQISTLFFRFVTKHACDRQNRDPRYGIAASRGKKLVEAD